jgi:hypothetical protein
LFGLGASSSATNQFQQPPDTSLDSFDLKINQGFRYAGRELFTSMPRPPLLPIPADTRSDNLSLQLIERVKADAEVYMVRLIFETSFFPGDAVLTRMANDALSLAVAQHHNGNYFNSFCFVAY